MAPYQLSRDLTLFDHSCLIEYVSTFTKLEVGDSISTGTPGGVGHKRNPQVFMKAGDVLEVEVTGLGRLRNGVRGESEY